MLRELSITLVFAVAFGFPLSHGSELKLEPRTVDERGVKVTVAPQGVPGGAATWNFQVTLETHTQDLNDDLAESSVLVAGGKRYMPSRWEGAPPGGHHRKGLLTFRALDPQPASIELQIRLTGDAAPRSFKWALR